MKIIKGCKYKGTITGIIVESLETIDPLSNKSTFEAKVIDVSNSYAFKEGMIISNFDVHSFKLFEETEVEKLKNTISVIVTDYLNNVSSNPHDFLKFVKTIDFENLVRQKLNL